MSYSEHPSYFARLVDALRLKHRATDYGEGHIFTTALCVCQSNAGFYVGYWCIEAMENHYGDNDWLAQPYDRQSEYFASFEGALAYLDYLTQGEEA